MWYFKTQRFDGKTLGIAFKMPLVDPQFKNYESNTHLIDVLLSVVKTLEGVEGMRSIHQLHCKKYLTLGDDLYFLYQHSLIGTRLSNWTFAISFLWKSVIIIPTFPLLSSLYVFSLSGDLLNVIGFNKNNNTYSWHYYV